MRFARFDNKDGKWYSEAGGNNLVENCTTLLECVNKTKAKGFYLKCSIPNCDNECFSDEQNITSDIKCIFHTVDGKLKNNIVLTASQRNPFEKAIVDCFYKNPMVRCDFTSYIFPHRNEDTMINPSIISDAVFCCDIIFDFTRAIKISFNTLTFYKKVTIKDSGIPFNLLNIRFYDDVVFVNISNVELIIKNSQFDKSLIFENVTSKLSIEINNCRLNDLVFDNLHNVKNISLSNINNTDQEIIIKYNKLPNDYEAIIHNPSILFNNLIFDRDGNVHIHNISVNGISFKGTSLVLFGTPCFNFTNIKWNNDFYLLDDPLHKNKTVKLTNYELTSIRFLHAITKFKFIFVGDLSKSSVYDNDCKELAKHYHDLRIIYEKDEDYTVAGNFYKHEMRLYILNLKRHERLISSIYGLLCDYGESYFKPFIWLLSILIIQIIGLHIINDGININLSFCNYFSYASLYFWDSVALILYLFNYILTGRIDNNLLYIEKSPYMPWMILFRIIELILITLGILALKRRFRRKS